MWVTETCSPSGFFSPSEAIFCRRGYDILKANSRYHFALLWKEIANNYQNENGFDSQAQWRVPVVPATQEIEATESLSPGHQGQHWQHSEVLTQKPKLCFNPAIPLLKFPRRIYLRKFTVP
jgi:hypothetical protein